MEEVPGSRYPAGIGGHVRERNVIPWVAEASVRGYHEAPEPYIGCNGNGHGQDDVVPDPSQECRVRDDGCHQPIGFIARPYSRAMSVGRYFVYEVR